MDIAGCSLAELIDDPLIGLVMKSDGVDRRELERLLERVARTAIAGAPICGTPVKTVATTTDSRSPISLEVGTEVGRVNRGRRSL